MGKPYVSVISDLLSDSAAPPPTDDACILIVDDSSTILAVLSSMLRRNGYRNLATATNGREAIALIPKLHPDLVITDLLMPEVSGFELCRWIRAQEDHRDIPILAQSGLEKSEGSVEVFAAGATDLIAKPINTHELIGRVRVHLERRRLIESLTEFRRNMEMELQMARAMQQSLLPSDSSLARVSGKLPVDIAHFYQASIGLGGDIWSLLPFGTDRLAFYIADFSGHGVAAALNTFRLHTYLNRASGGSKILPPEEFLADLNRYLCATLELGQFATCLAGIVDFTACTLTFSSAAAPPALLVGSEGAAEILDCSGFPLGATSLATFEPQVRPFPPGSTLFTYSDALIETPDPPNSAFTPERLKLLLEEYDGLPLPEIQSRIITGLYEESDAKPTDDLTTVIIKHRA